VYQNTDSVHVKFFTTIEVRSITMLLFVAQTRWIFYGRQSVDVCGGSGGIARPFLTSLLAVGAALSQLDRILDSMEKRKILPLLGIELRLSSQYASTIPVKPSRLTYLKGGRGEIWIFTTTEARIMKFYILTPQNISSACIKSRLIHEFWNCYKAKKIRTYVPEICNFFRKYRYFSMKF
jgi:hypothetical protein